MTFFIIDFSEI